MSERGERMGGSDADKPGRAGVTENATRPGERFAAMTDGGGVAEMRNVAGQIVDEIRDAAEALLEEQKERAADAVHSVADALQRTAQTLDRENMPIARYATRAAERIDEFSERFRQRRWSDLSADAAGLARHQPALFLAGAIAMGFVFGRFMVSSAESGGGRTAYAGNRPDIGRPGSGPDPGLDSGDVARRDVM